MKLNSNSILITKESEEYKELEAILNKIASDNKVEDVVAINVELRPGEGIASYKLAGEGCECEEKGKECDHKKKEFPFFGKKKDDKKDDKKEKEASYLNAIETVLTKIASENEMEHVAGVHISITPERGFVRFEKVAGVEPYLSILDSGTATPQQLNDAEQAIRDDIRSNPAKASYLNQYLTKIKQLREAEGSMDQMRADSESFAPEEERATYEDLAL